MQVLPQLVDSSTLKRDVVNGVDIMIVRELVGGVYFGEPRGFGKNEAGEKTGFNTMIYSESEVERIAKVCNSDVLLCIAQLCPFNIAWLSCPGGI